MSGLTDPETIGEKRPAAWIKTGWHVAGGLALHDAIVGTGHTVVDTRRSDGQTEAWVFRPGEYVWTRTPAEQVAYIEACHRQRIAEASLATAVLSARPVPPCNRPQCAATRREIRQLRARLEALRLLEVAR